MDPWSAVAGGAKVLSQDITYSQVLAAKKALTLIADHKDLVVQLCLGCANNDSFQIKQLLTEDKSVLNSLDGQGLTPLIYAICFNNKECADILLAFGADSNQADRLVGWTPIMWAVYFDYRSIVENLLSSNADPYLKSEKTNKSAVDLLKPNTPLYEYFQSHNYLNKPKSSPVEEENAFYKESFVSPTEEDDAFEAQLKLQTAGVNSLSVSDDLLTNKRKRHASSGNSKFVSEESLGLEGSYDDAQFDFNHLLPKQYKRFNDESMSQTMDFIFALYSKYHNRPIYVAAIVYQCLRYADAKIDRSDYVEMFTSYFLTRVRSLTNTKSGVVQFATSEQKPTDIVLLGYWISCINHLYYFLYRDGVSRFYDKYPQLLQDLISVLQPMISQLAFSLDSKLESLLEPCILDFNSVPDLDVLYKNDWKMFKSKLKLPKSSYDEILDMLYPPSIEEQMKPSPLKIIQTLGALVYVLELFHINEVIKQQCFAGVLYWFGSSLFNRIIANRKYTTRLKALQIRLNLSYIQDWLRTNNLIPFRAPDYDFDDPKYPDSIINEKIALTNVARFRGNKHDPMDATFYYSPLYKIGLQHLQPVTELLEWLQIMTSLRNDMDSFKETLHNFENLNSRQILKTIKNYNYEINEPKFSPALRSYLKKHPFDAKHSLYYISSDKEFLNTGQVFPVTLPNLVELLHQYGGDFKEYDSKKLRLYQPNLPVEIDDDLDDIYDKYGREGELYESNIGDADDDNGDATNGDSTILDDDVLGNPVAAADNRDYFSSITVPSTSARKTWNSGVSHGEEENPWA